MKISSYALFLLLLVSGPAPAPPYDHHPKYHDATITNPHESKLPSTRIYVEGKCRVIISDGLPDHGHGEFPNPHNPHEIQAQSYSFRISAEPSLTGSVSHLRLGEPFGIALNGVPLDPEAAAYWYSDPADDDKCAKDSGLCDGDSDGKICNLNPRETPPDKWQADPLSASAPDLGLDANMAHVQPSGAYHYHGLTPADATKTPDSMVLAGWAFDGFPIYRVYGYRDPMDSSSGLREMKPRYQKNFTWAGTGRRPTGDSPSLACYPLGTFVDDYSYKSQAIMGDLDECNGRYGVTPEFPEGIYHYFLTENFPYIPRCFKGNYDVNCE